MQEAGHPSTADAPSIATTDNEFVGGVEAEWRQLLRRLEVHSNGVSRAQGNDVRSTLEGVGVQLATLSKFQLLSLHFLAALAWCGDQPGK